MEDMIAGLMDVVNILNRYICELELIFIVALQLSYENSKRLMH